MHNTFKNKVQKYTKNEIKEDNLYQKINSLENKNEIINAKSEENNNNEKLKNIIKEYHEYVNKNNTTILKKEQNNQLLDSKHNYD